MISEDRYQRSRLARVPALALLVSHSPSLPVSHTAPSSIIMIQYHRGDGTMRYVSLRVLPSNHHSLRAFWSPGHAQVAVHTSTDICQTRPARLECCSSLLWGQHSTFGLFAGCTSAVCNGWTTTGRAGRSTVVHCRLGLVPRLERAPHQ